MHILAGDIGGTHTRLRIVDCAANHCRVLHDRQFASREYAGVDQVLRAFFEDAAWPIDSVCLAVAGPVAQAARGQSVRLTNLPWRIETDSLARAFGFPRVRLINDFQAVGYGIEALGDDDLVVLQSGKPVAHAPRAVIGAGTGLGQAILVWQGERYAPIATEGGHVDFGPTDELQIELARHLLRRHGHASYELVLSGPGLLRLYEFLRAAGVAAESPELATALNADDPAAVLTRAALARSDRLATATVELFVRIYGAQAGNLALAAGAGGGLYVAGGIAPRIVALLADGGFLQAFRHKGGMAALASTIPVLVVMNPNVGLLGAVRAAQD
jgi:glucokinase